MIYYCNSATLGVAVQECMYTSTGQKLRHDCLQYEVWSTNLYLLMKKCDELASSCLAIDRDGWELTEHNGVWAAKCYYYPRHGFLT